MRLDSVFPGRLGRPLTGAGIWHIVRQIAQRAGIQELAPHDLRRTGMKLARDGGAPLEQISLCAGHSAVQTTVRYLGNGLEVRKGKAATDAIQF